MVVLEVRSVSRHDSESRPFQVERLVESEYRAGKDLAWIVVASVVLCVAAIAFRLPDRLLAGIEDADSLNVNGVLALMVVVPLGASMFAMRRYRDAVDAQLQLTHLSLHDALTDLPNRRHLREVLPSAFVHARRLNTQAAVFFIDLDRFKAVNDTYGHEVGDKLMAAVANRLRQACEPGRWVARYAGDEFVLVDPAPHTRDQAGRFAKELVRIIEMPFELGEDQISISASIGVAFGEGTDDPEEVLTKADAAMYRAKAGPGRTTIYCDDMGSQLTPVTAQRRLQAALDQGEFKLLFQPIMALSTRQMVGVEALLRWDDPERGVISPIEFLGPLEDTGLIVPVGRWVLQEACRQARRWADMLPDAATALKVTVNVSPRQLSQVDFVDDLRAALDGAGVEAAQLFLELTEDALITDPRAAWSALSEVREFGVGLVLDDFGTGYSSLTHLRNLDLALLKLDGTLLPRLGRVAKDDAIVRHIVSLARTLGIATLAEGITEAREVDVLLEFGCELGQGHYFSAPQPATMIDSLINTLMLPAGVDGATEPLLETMSETGPGSAPAVVLPRLRNAAP